MDAQTGQVFMRADYTGGVPGPAPGPPPPPPPPPAPGPPGPPGACTLAHHDTYATGKHVACCTGLNETLEMKNGRCPASHTRCSNTLG